FERVSKTDGAAVTRVAAANVHFALGDGTNTFLEITAGQGGFLIGANGLAGGVSGTVHVANPGVALAGPLEVPINETADVVSGTFLVGDQTVLINLPAGPFLRIAGTNVNATILGQTLSGDFVFEKTTSNGSPIVKVAITNVHVGLGDGTTELVSVTGGSAI